MTLRQACRLVEAVGLGASRSLADAADALVAAIGEHDTGDALGSWLRRYGPSARAGEALVAGQLLAAAKVQAAAAETGVADAVRRIRRRRTAAWLDR